VSASFLWNFPSRRGVPSFFLLLCRIIVLLETLTAGLDHCVGRRPGFLCEYLQNNDSVVVDSVDHPPIAADVIDAKLMAALPDTRHWARLGHRKCVPALHGSRQDHLEDSCVNRGVYLNVPSGTVSIGNCLILRDFEINELHSKRAILSMM
jgi:hypothetical protein